LTVEHNETLTHSIADADVRAEALGENGPLLHIARRLALIPRRGHLLRIGLAIALVTWLPLLVLTALDGTRFTGRVVPFRWSMGSHVRFLLAIPLYFVSEERFTGRIVEVLQSLVRVGVVPAGDLDRFAKAAKQTRRLWDSWGVELALVVVAVASISVGLRTDLPGGISTWRTAADGTPSLAGRWYSLVSLPLFQFLLWRWLWHLLIWGRFLWKVSRLNLKLTPTHPDAAGGLGALGIAHVDLSLLNFGCSAMIAASVAEQVKFGGASISDLSMTLGLVVTGQTLLFIAPLFAFASRLLDVRQRGLLEYGDLANRYTQGFHDRWITGTKPPEGPLLGTADVQSLADLGNSFRLIEKMWIVPISMRQLVTMALFGAARRFRCAVSDSLERHHDEHHQGCHRGLSAVVRLSCGFFRRCSHRVYNRQLRCV
jgi:hypothetical protein